MNVLMGRWVGLLGVLVLGGCGSPAGEDAGEAAGRMEAAVPAGGRDAEAMGRDPVAKPEPYVTPGLITEVDLQGILELQDAGKVLLVDVRPSMFYGMGHMPGAISLPRKGYEAKYPKQKTALDEAVAADRAIVLYCANVKCPDGYTVAKLLSAQGYAVSIYKGGWEEWKATGF